MKYPRPRSPVFYWLNDSWDHGSTPRELGRIASRQLQNRYALVLGSVAAGLCGGILMAILAVGIAVSHDQSALAPFLLIDGIFKGFFSHTLGTGSAASLGIFIHFALSALFGGIFSFLFRIYANEESTLDALFGGLAFGVLIWGFMNYGFLMRWSDSSLEHEMNMMPSAWFFAHLLFGATFCLAPTFTRAIQKTFGRKVREKEGRTPLRKAA